jgi:hypothetical protein
MIAATTPPSLINKSPSCQATPEANAETTIKRTQDLRSPKSFLTLLTNLRMA